jgi:hypothetical protein
MAADDTPISPADARRCAADTARAEAVIRADAAWRDTYDRTFARIYTETLVDLLDDQKAWDAIAAPSCRAALGQTLGFMLNDRFQRRGKCPRICLTWSERVLGDPHHRCPESRMRSSSKPLPDAVYISRDEDDMSGLIPESLNCIDCG